MDATLEAVRAETQGGKNEARRLRRGGTHSRGRLRRGQNQEALAGFRRPEDRSRASCTPSPA